MDVMQVGLFDKADLSRWPATIITRPVSAIPSATRRVSPSAMTMIAV